MRLISLMSLIVLFAAGAWAKALPLAPVKILVQPGDEVEVRGFRGSFEYVVRDGARDVTIEVRQRASAKAIPFQDEWQFSTKREKSVVFISIDGPASKQIWNEVLVSNSIPEYDLRLTGPSLPLSVNWNEGRIVVPQLNADIRVTALKADVVVTKGEGSVAIVNQEGSVTVHDRKGEVKVDSYLAKVDVENIDGRLDVENFTGESRVNQINGNVSMSSFKGVTKLASVKGRLEFRNGIAPLHIEKFEGELRGRSGQGAVYAEVRGDANVRVESAEGAVNLRLPASGAWVNLGTEEGALAVPSFLKLTRLSTQQIRTGRLKGATGGSVFVRTTSGDIRLR